MNRRSQISIAIAKLFAAQSLIIEAQEIIVQETERSQEEHAKKYGGKPEKPGWLDCINERTNSLADNVSVVAAYIRSLFGL